MRTELLRAELKLFKVVWFWTRPFAGNWVIRCGVGWWLVSLHLRFQEAGHVEEGVHLIA